MTTTLAFGTGRCPSTSLEDRLAKLSPKLYDLSRRSVREGPPLDGLPPLKDAAQFSCPLREPRRDAPISGAEETPFDAGPPAI